jgi:O-antigen ligase
LLAKIWYIVPFYFLSYLLFRTEKNIRAWFFWVLIPLTLTVVVIIVRHGLLGFSFESANDVLKPFYRNHVDYALILGVFFPFVFVLRDRWMHKTSGLVLCAVLLLAIYLTYTRAAYVGLLVAVGGFLLARWRLIRYAILAALIVTGVFLVSLSRDNRYIDYAPDYYKTVTHYKFENLLEATYRFEDVSTMERFYRWIAAFYMVREQPIVGFGPNNFVSFYKPYADKHFVTYVSDNPEQSGVHNYFLMTTVEQGLPGLIIFLALLFITLLRAEWLYHKLKPGFYRKLITGVIGSLFFILFALSLNDMIETDKVGSFFFLNLSLIAIIERNARQEHAFKNPAAGV